MKRNGDRGALFVANSCYCNHNAKIPHHCGFPVMTVVRGHGNDARRDLPLHSVHANCGLHSASNNTTHMHS